MIKICGITEAEDAAVAAGGGADAIGLNFFRKSKRYINPEQAARILEGVPAGMLKVGVFVNEPPERIEAIVAQLGLDVAQLHGDEPASRLPKGVRVWKAFRVDKAFDAQRFDAYAQAEAFVLDGPAGADYGGSGKTFSWADVTGLGQRIIIAGGLDASNVREAIRIARPWGVDACSRIESAPGKKDHQKLLSFITAARSEE